MGKRKNNEGSYGKKKIKDFFYEYYRYPDGKYIYGKTPKELAAKKKEEDARRKGEALATPSKNFDYIFSDYCEEWLKSIYGTVASSTYDQYAEVVSRRIKNFKKYDIGNIQIKSLIPKMFTNYFTALGEEYSKQSVDKTWSIVQRVLKAGMKDGVIPSFDLSEIQRPKERDVKVKKKIVKFITLNDMEELYKESQRKNSSKKEIYGNASKLLVFIMYSGVRIGEAIGLQWKYVSPDYSEVRIHESTSEVVKRDKDGNPLRNSKNKLVKEKIQKSTKSEAGDRSIPLPERAQEALRYMDEQFPNHSPSDHVFLTSKGTVYNRRSVERCLSRMLESSECACKDYTPHELRHGYGSVLISKGVDIKIVSKLLGHTDVAFTYNVYIGVLKEDEINAVKSVFNSKKED